MPTIQVKLNPKTRRAVRPTDANVVLRLDLNLLGKATTAKGAGVTLATATPQDARLSFWELAMKGDADAPTPGVVVGDDGVEHPTKPNPRGSEVAWLLGKVRLDGQKPVFDATGKVLEYRGGAPTGGYVVDLEWGKAFAGVDPKADATRRLRLPAALDWKAEAGTLELGCSLEVGGTGPGAPTEFMFRYDPTDPKKPGDFVSVALHLLAAPKAEVYDDATILSELEAQAAAVMKTYAPARVVALRSPGNGERPVFAVVPAGLDPAAPFKVQTHYHGLASAVHQGPHVERVKALVKAGALVVLPESRDMATHRWSNVVDQARTTRDAEAAVKAALKATAWSVSERHVSFHSAGGDVLRRVADLSPAKGLEADHLQLLDCLYNTKSLDEAKFPGVTDATVTLVKALPAARVVYRRYENHDVEPSGATTKKRGEVIQDQVGAGRFVIYDGGDPANKGKPGYPASHDDAARYLGEPG